ncbi:hypothetical protein LTR10_011011 [Elasticomyces elasticus]|nr:hypothetical protein LTR10_011011 [Elasticomyces elasticus]KAK4968615.1 hypothetical protein LTR42_009898 [Elasticomyces elasticus]
MYRSVPRSSVTTRRMGQYYTTHYDRVPSTRAQSNAVPLRKYGTHHPRLFVDQAESMVKLEDDSVNAKIDKTVPFSTARAEDLFWQKIKSWENVSKDEFLSYRWQLAHMVERKSKLLSFLRIVLPASIPASNTDKRLSRIQSRDDFLQDVESGMKVAPMAVRLTPYILSVADWSNPLDDPVRKQFIPLASTIVQDHPQLSLDSLHETDDSHVPGLVHRYPEKVLFLATSVCPVYCRFCTRSYAVGGNTESVTKASMKPTKRRWEAMLAHIESTPAIQDVVVSGGDSYYLAADHLRFIGDRLLAIPHIKRFRFATKGLAVNPIRILDRADGWTDAFVELSNKGRMLGKQVAMHTHFNSVNEITWVTELAARYLFERGVTVRNQTVVLRGVNDDLKSMSTLIRKLADLNIQPYYVYQSDMVQGVEDLRTPLATILNLEKQIRGTIAGFMTPTFVVDLPGGGGKRLANSFESYDQASGLSTWKAPGVKGEKVFTYHDPIAQAHPNVA